MLDFDDVPFDPVAFVFEVVVLVLEFDSFLDIVQEREIDRDRHAGPSVGQVTDL